MKSKDIIVLQKILKYCNEINQTCQHFGTSIDEFSNNFIFRNACSMCILQIGELCKVISDELRNEVPEIPWKSWCGITLFPVSRSIQKRTIRKDGPFLLL